MQTLLSFVGPLEAVDIEDFTTIAAVDLEPTTEERYLLCFSVAFESFDPGSLSIQLYDATNSKVVEGSEFEATENLNAVLDITDGLGSEDLKTLQIQVGNCSGFPILLNSTILSIQEGEHIDV